MSNLVVIMVVQGYLTIQKYILQLEVEFGMLQKLDLASLYLRHDIQASGYRGVRSCDPSLLDLQHSASSKANFPQERIIFVTTNPFALQNLTGWQKIKLKSQQQKLKYNSDILIIKDIPKQVYSLQAPLHDRCAFLHVQASKSLKAGTELAIADSTAIERFVASSIINAQYIYHQLPENKNACFANIYTLDAELIALEQVMYYLAKPEPQAASFTLYRDAVLHPAAGLIDGVEDFYSKEIFQQPKLEQNIAETVEDSTKVCIGVSLGLLLRSDLKLCKEQALSWRGKQRIFNDGWCRQALEFTVATRNVC